MKIVQLFLIALVLAVMATGNSVAGKPTISEGIFNGNGFPSGPHYNLILHGKKDSYTCSPEKWVCTPDSGDLVEFEDQSSCESLCGGSGVCEQVFGNVINMPYDNATGQILIESGRKGPKGATDVETLRVTDACAGFDTDDDAASFQLPANKDGYALYIKIVGKPSDETSASFALPDFEYVEDELGNALILLGAVIGEELVQVDADNIVVFRSDANIKGNKVQKATDLTPLFTYSGTTCYFNSTNDTGFDYCLDDVCYQDYACCQDINLNGIYDGTDCVGLAVIDGDGNLVCSDDGFVPITVSCRNYYSDPQWIFNIADFVGMLWEVTNNGAYNIQLRFYPLPLN